MTDFENLEGDLLRLRMQAQTANADDTAHWDEGDRARLNCEIRWCVEALQELQVRIKAAASQR